MMVRKQIGKTFHEALKKHIPAGHVLVKAINQHMVKLSYSTMPSMASKIGANNNKINRDSSIENEVKETCNCPKTKLGQPFTCKFNGTCLRQGLIYKCTATDSNGNVKWNYIGNTSGNIKARISSHDWTFKDKARAATTLPKQVIKDKEEGRILSHSWERIAYARARAPNNKMCNLCSKETLLLMRRDSNSINKKEELGGYCPHRRGHLIFNIKSNLNVRKQQARYKRRKQRENIDHT